MTSPEPTARGAEDMTAREVMDLVFALTEGEMRIMLTLIAGYRPQVLDYALARVRGEAS